ncbi:MAG: hypothetical protein J6K14_09050 [Clostridia bacterium]|nr:hypothetical protein [Clostridia bacterium]
MKRIITLLLAITVCFSLFGCQKYEPQKSTKREETPIATMKYGKEKFEVKYELFRMLFLSAKETVSDGDLSRFEGEEASALLEEARAVALDKIYEIYATFALCEALDIDLYSRKVDKKVEESITISIEGGYAENGQYIEGLGSYEEYLKNLSLFYMNYAVQDLMIRYSYGVSAIGAHYRGTYDDYGNKAEEGALTYTDADVDAFYNSEDTRRIFLVFTQKEEWEAQSLRGKIAAEPTEELVSAYILGHTFASEVDAKDGHVIGKYTLDNGIYANVTDAAFALQVGETSELIPGIYDGYKGFFILYRASKSAENLAQIRESVAKNYVENEIGKRLAAAKTELKASTAFTDFYNTLSLSEVHMSEEKE